MRFEEFSLSKETLRSISGMGFEEPTPIQVAAIPLILRGIDLVGQAQTGTGKTAAFGIPIVETYKKGKSPFTIILEPTRELAVQVSQEINMLGQYKNMHVLPVYGGKSIDAQIKALRRGVDVVVGTPGRIIDHIQRKTISLSDIKIVVLDEADEMLDMGFIEDIETILRSTSADRQTLLFSATMPREILNIAKRYMKSPEKVRINPEDLVVPQIKQVFYEVRTPDKINVLSRLLDVEDPKLAIVFCHTKMEVDEVSMKLKQMGYSAEGLHGDFSQAQREDVMKKFKKGMLDLLVATDVAARGLDIKDVSHVINYSIPQNPENYIHRIGRTGRAGRSGIAITLVTPREYQHLKLIEKIAMTRIGKKDVPTAKEVIKAKEKGIMRGITDIIRENKQEGYVQAVRELAQGHSLDDIAAAALFAAYGELNGRPFEEQPEKTGVVRLFMTIGRRDRIKVTDIVRAIAKEANIPYAKIGSIDVFNEFSFAEVPEGLADRVIGSLNDMMMKGKRVKVEQARERKGK